MNLKFDFYDILKKCDIEPEYYDESNNTLNISQFNCLNLTSLELDVLNKIETINGDLIIKSESLKTINSFNFLKKINNLTIHDSNNLELITGFNSLESLESLTISYNKSLKNIYGFNKLFNFQPIFNGVIKIINNKMLKSINFLSGLQKVSSSFYLHYNGLTTLKGLEELEFVDASFSLSSNNLKDLKELKNLKVVNGMLGLVNNKLETLKGLEGLEYLRTIKWNGNLRTLALNSNPKLKDISALNKLKVEDDKLIIIVDSTQKFYIKPYMKSHFFKNNIHVLANDKNRLLLKNNYLKDAIKDDNCVEFLHDINEYFSIANHSNLGANINIIECKFIIIDIETSNPKLYWMNTKKNKYHNRFYSDILGREVSIDTFDSISYSEKNRKNIVGTLVYHEKPIMIDNQKLFFAINFWPSDSIKFKNISMAFDMVLQRANFVKDKLFFHVVSDLQQYTITKQKEKFEKSHIKCINSQTIMQNIDFLPMNYGISYGILRFAKDTQNFSIKDIVVLNELPNHLSHVSGILTDLPQTPLSHINLLAKQNKIPNAYLKNASQNKELLDLKDQYVKLEVTANNYKIIKTNAKDMEKYFNAIRPKKELIPKVDLNIKTIESFRNLNNFNYTAYGTKTANLGELYNIFKEENLPDGFGIPFYFYDEFMKYNDFYKEIENLSILYDENEDIEYRNILLAAFRYKIREAKIPEWMENEFKKIIAYYPSNTKLRFRSSTNNEDLEDFSGAGLYDSFSYKDFSLPISSTVKKVWASVFNYRAYEERRFYKIKHTKTMMGISVHPRYKKEQVNGVAVTRNIFNQRNKGFYINVQTGESLVTNPDEFSIPEEIVVVYAENKKDFVFQYIRYSNILKGRKKVLKKKYLLQLVNALEKLSIHFKKIYHAENNKTFSMEIEFKITKDGVFQIKQARPWIEAN